MKHQKAIKLSDEEKTVSSVGLAVPVFQSPNFQAKTWKKFRSF
jgi:hypothetical protein